MTAEQVEPITWRISADNPPHALRTLQAADRALTKRLRELNATTLTQWPGFELRVHADGGSRLFADRVRGEAIEELVKRLLRDGLRGRVRIEIQW